MRTKQGAIAIALGAVVSLALAACSGGGGSTAASASGSSGGGSSAATGAKGGTLTWLTTGPQEHWDPQRTYVGVDIEFAGRAFYRSLTAYTAGKDPKVVPDLATDMGTVSDGGKTWKFTVKDGIKWQDGQPVKCEDVKYGISRTFAQDVITGGPNYIITFLDIPTVKDAKGNPGPAYAGPYTKKGQDLYEKAVSCTGNTITLHFKTPWSDFNIATAGLPAYSPFRQDKDLGDKSDYAVFSNGPYMLQGTFDKDKGGTFVRNPNWDPATDTIRKAYPDQINYVVGLENNVIFQRLIADGAADKAAVSGVQAPAAILPQIAANPGAVSRALTGPAPYVDYIQPNVRSKVFSNEKARQAFAMATNRDAYVTAYGGKQAAIPSYAMCNQATPCYKDFNPFGVPTAGDAAAAKKVLQESGLTLPVPITVVFRNRPPNDKALPALKQTWDAAGFSVTLEPLTTKYYATIQTPAYANRDAFWAGWGADWPGGSTVLPPLFDDRPNISAGGSGQDYGYFKDDSVDKAIDAAYAVSDPAAREKAWADIDEAISKKVGVIPLDNQKFTFLAGSSVKGLETNALIGGYVDIANIAVQ